MSATSLLLIGACLSRLIRMNDLLDLLLHLVRHVVELIRYSLHCLADLIPDLLHRYLSPLVRLLCIGTELGADLLGRITQVAGGDLRLGPQVAIQGAHLWCRRGRDVHRRCVQVRYRRRRVRLDRSLLLAGRFLRGNGAYLRAERYISGTIMIGLGVTAAFAGNPRK